MHHFTKTLITACKLYISSEVYLLCMAIRDRKQSLSKEIYLSKKLVKVSDTYMNF